MTQSHSNTNERTVLQKAVQTLAVELGASEGDALVLDADLMPTLVAGGGGGDGGLSNPITEPLIVFPSVAGGEFALAVTQPDGATNAIAYFQAATGGATAIDKHGGVVIEPDSASTQAALSVANDNAEQNVIEVWDPNFNTLKLAVSPQGQISGGPQVLITDPDGLEGTGNGISWNAGGADGEQYFRVQIGASGEHTLRFVEGELEINGQVAISADAGKLGFFGAAAATRPAAPVTLEDVIAALQTLGLVAS